jgi:uncharacterized protein YneF (UPF0154 family)
VNPSRLVLVVLATVVIFAAGVVTGSLITRKTTRFQIAQPFWGRFEMTRRAVDDMGRRGQLTPEQHVRLDEIIRDHQELIADYFNILEPDVQQVFRKMRENIREELTAEQRKQFEELSRKRVNNRPGDQPEKRPKRGGEPEMLPPVEQGPRPPN